LRQRLEQLIYDQFQGTQRVYETSALLGFHASQLRHTHAEDRFGLDTLFATGTYRLNAQADVPQFVSEFTRYCASSGKLPADRFRIEVKSYESPNENYVRILREQGPSLIEQLIRDSGIEDFRQAITHYLTQEKRPLLLATLADDLQPLCIRLREFYLDTWQALYSQPQDIEVIKEQELRQLSRELKQIGDDLYQHIAQEVNEAVASNANAVLERDFLKLKAKMVSRLDELLNTFSVGEVHKRAQASHHRNSVVPLLGILAEAFYYLANGLEDVLVAAAQELVTNFFQQLIERMRQQPYYRALYRLLGNDGGIEQRLVRLEQQVADVLTNEARIECDRYLRERPEFYMEGTSSMFQLRQTLQQACRGYDYQNMVDAEPAIRQLLKLDFEQKVKETALRTFRQTINQTLNTHLLGHVSQQAEALLQQYDHARLYLAQTLEKEAQEKIRNNQRQQATLQQKVALYKQAVDGINTCLEEMQLDRKKLPLMGELSKVFPPHRLTLETADATMLNDEAADAQLQEVSEA
jgi:hypothetical protein